MKKTLVPAQYRTYVNDMAKYLRTQFYHGEYSFDVEFHSESKDEGTGRAPAAEIRIDPTYLNFTIRLYPITIEFYRQKKYDRVGEIMCHEMAHILTEPLYRLAVDSVTNTSKENLEDVRERQTQRIVNVVMDLLPDNWYTPKKLRQLL